MVNSANPLSRKKLEDTLVVWDSVTSGAGAAGGTTLVDATLIGKNDFITNQVTVLILDGVCAGEKGTATAFAPLTGTITFAAMTAQIAAGTAFRLLNFASPEDLSAVPADVTTIKAATLATVSGRLQEAATTISLNQAAATYDLLTGTTQAVILESLTIQMPVGAAGGALTGITIQVNDATPQPIITAAQGLVANLTSENQLTWEGICRIGVGKKVQLTIVGGAHGAAYVCNVVAQYRAVISGGTLA